jgi:CRP/FNR family transcriptional regulator
MRLARAPPTRQSAASQCGSDSRNLVCAIERGRSRGGKKDWTSTGMGETKPDDAADAEQAARRVGGLSVRFRAGETIFRPGDSARGWIVVESGRVRVGLTADTGREVVLYRLGTGDSCLLTTSALLRQETMLAEAVAETDVAARLVPVATFERLLAEDAAFRRAVLRNYAERVGELVVVIQDVLFHALRERLARHLIAHAHDGAVEATHQAIAAELGSAREVVTRALNRFEREGLIRVERARIVIIDADRLARSSATQA